MADFVDPDVTQEIVDGKDKLVAQANRAETLLDTLEDAIGSSIGDMNKQVYDPNGIEADAFDMDNMVEGATSKIMTDAERSKLAGIEAGAEVNPNATEVKSLYESNSNTNAFTDAEQSKLAGIEAGAEVNVVDEAPINGVQYARQDGAWEPVVGGGGGGGSGDMTKAVYDPNSVAGDAFDMDNMESGTTNKVFTTAQETKLAGIEANAEVNTVDSVHGRSGAVVAASGDYEADQVDYDNTASGLTATDVQGAIDEVAASAGGGGGLGGWEVISIQTGWAKAPSISHNDMDLMNYDEVMFLLDGLRIQSAGTNLTMQFYDSGVLLETNQYRWMGQLMVGSGTTATVTDEYTAHNTSWPLADDLAVNTGFYGTVLVGQSNGRYKLDVVWPNNNTHISWRHGVLTHPTPGTWFNQVTGYKISAAAGDILSLGRVVVLARKFTE